MQQRAPSPPALSARDAVIAAVTALAYFGLSYATTVLTSQPNNTSGIRLGGALLLGVMVRRQVGVAAGGLLLLLGYVAMAMGLYLGGRAPPVAALAIALPRALELALAYVLLRAMQVDATTLKDFPRIARLVLVTVFIAPAAGASVGAWVTMKTLGASYPDAFAAWWVGNAFGMVVLLPVVLAFTRERVDVLMAPGHRIALLSTTLLTLLVVALSATLARHPFVLMMLPLLYAAFRFGVLGTAVQCLLASITVLLLHRYVVTHPDALASTAPSADFTEMAFYCSVTVIAPLLVSVLQEKRATAARALRQARSQLRTVIDNVPALIGQLDADRRYTLVNDQYAEWFGRPAEAFIGRTAVEMLGEAQAAALSDQVARVMDGETVRFELPIAGREASIVFVPEWRDGKVAGYLVLAYDISERKAAERALFEEKERIQVTLDSIGDAVVVCDRDLCVTLLNPVAEVMTGWSEAEAIGHPIDRVVELIDLKHGTPPLSPLRIAIRDNRTVALQFDTALRRRDGVETPIEDSAAPIHDSSGAVVGGVMVFRDVSELRTMAVKMSHLAQHDYLTDLPNRVLLHDRLSHALAATAGAGSSGALMFIDLDHFKTINDSLGHQVGDCVLQEVSRRLLSVIRDDDTVSRQGGDEFVVLLERLGDPRDAARVAQKLLQAMRAPIDAEGHELYLSLSIGIALFPQDSSDAQTLMMQADTALYHSKQGGRNQFSYFSTGMSEKADARLRLENDLRDALRDRELILVYQPKVERPGERITGMEALVRWPRRNGPMAMPADFIPVAEESGLITQLDEWVMDEACRQNVAWQRAGLPSLPISVNVSLARFDPGRLLARVAEVLASSGMAPDLLQIEFTETQMFADETHARALIEGLHALGVRIALDDFGTGYSSLRYLLQYRFNTLKIDRSFVTGLPEDAKQVAVVRAIIAMAHALEAAVVAEGVETIGQARMLEHLGCPEVQGFLYSHPVPASVMGLLLGRGQLEPRPAGAGQWPSAAAPDRPAAPGAS